MIFAIHLKIRESDNMDNLISIACQSTPTYVIQANSLDLPCSDNITEVHVYFARLLKLKAKKLDCVVTPDRPQSKTSPLPNPLPILSPPCRRRVGMNLLGLKQRVLSQGVYWYSRCLSLTLARIETDGTKQEKQRILRPMPGSCFA